MKTQKELSQKERDVNIGFTVDPHASQAPRIIEDFEKLFYNCQFTTMWMGYSLMKNPLDLWIYQEILYECRPDLIIECGTAKGGSALYLAHLCDIMQHGQIVTVDIQKWVGCPFHQRITYYTGSSTDEKTVREVKGYANGFRKIMVILDSDHAKKHVLNELEAYSPIVTPGQYLIVEDTNVHGHPVRDDHGPGPWEALDAWLPKNENFVVDRFCERYLCTHNPRGYLRRMK
jgi:cephalosporin hydroxylase